MQSKQASSVTRPLHARLGMLSLMLQPLQPQALSWLVAPFLAGVASCFLFFVIRTFVLRAKNAYQRSLYVLPVFTFLTFFTVTWFTMVK
jgi:phosphate/sulfate permease